MGGGGGVGGGVGGGGVIISQGNGLSPVRWQANTWTNAG